MLFVKETITWELIYDHLLFAACKVTSHLLSVTLVETPPPS